MRYKLSTKSEILDSLNENRKRGPYLYGGYLNVHPCNYL